jgi:hypothetical protein
VIPLPLPEPQLEWKPAGPPQLEQPVEVRLPALPYPDGAEALEADALRVGAYIYRTDASGERVWDDKAQSWIAPPADLAALQPLPFIYKAGDPLPWQGTLIAIGMEDKDRQPRFAKAAGGEPTYRLRPYAKFKRDGVEYEGLGVYSAPLAFVSGLENQPFTVEMLPDPQAPQRVSIKLKNAALLPAGYLEIRALGGQEVEIANCDAGGAKLAEVLLAADGSIRLTPAAGRKVVLAGDLEARAIRYLSSDGTTMKDLA